MSEQKLKLPISQLINLLQFYEKYAQVPVADQAQAGTSWSVTKQVISKMLELTENKDVGLVIDPEFFEPKVEEVTKDPKAGGSKK